MEHEAFSQFLAPSESAHNSVTRQVDTEGKHLPVFVVIEEYDGIGGLEAHMAAKPLRELMETFKDPDVLDGEVVVKFSDGQYDLKLQHLTSFY
ncbi:hypothetical protein GGU11DRAFT_749876 [Lentinula aff. detonsa]|nr:hypothetical protein GGU11DRAFT_749876 [Lentinula aff. detonsa]